MAGVRCLLQSGELYFVKAHGCALGYKDSCGKLPYKKPLGFITRCPGCPAHEHIKGSNQIGRKSLQAAEWPEYLDRLVLNIIEQQVLVDNQMACAEDCT